MFQCLSKQTAPIINSRAVFYDVITYGTVLGMIAGIISHGLPLDIVHTHTHQAHGSPKAATHTHSPVSCRAGQYDTPPESEAEECGTP